MSYGVVNMKSRPKSRPVKKGLKAKVPNEWNTYNCTKDMNGKSTLITSDYDVIVYYGYLL